MSIVDKIAYKISGFNRQRKFRIFFEHINPSVSDSILDVGFSDMEYSATDNFLEKNYPHRKNITALGIEDPVQFPERYPEVKAIKYDGSIFPFRDKQFDIGWSNAVVEHVGNHNAQVLFVSELNRTCKKVFFTTPNKYFPVEVHSRIPLLHFLPKKIFDKILVMSGKAWAAGNYMNLLSKKQVKKILADAQVSNYEIIENKFLLFTLDFVIIIK
jgi:hypothetical protein